MSILKETGEYLMLMKKVFSRPEKLSIYRKRTLFEMEAIGLNSIGIVAIISIFMGAVVVIQMANNLESPFIPKMMIGYATRESLVLEFSSTIVALILAGKVGSNIASEIGTMRITEQIDALEIMGVNSANFLILPKIVGLVTMIPLLVIFSIVSGVAGAYATAYVGHIITATDLTAGMQHEFTQWFVWMGIIKSLFFAFIISSVSAFYGYNVEGGSIEVGKASTNAVVASSMLILFSDLFLTQLLS